MSDIGRKDLSDKAQEKVTPDSTKSTTEKVKESVTGTTDHVARDAQPDSSKSHVQSVTDKAGREKDHVHGAADDHHHGTTTTDNEPSTIDKIKQGLGVDKN